MCEIRRGPFRRLNLDFLACPDLDQRFRRRPVLLVGLEPDRAPQDFRVVINRRRRARTAALLLPRANLVRIVEVVAARSHRNFQPPIAIFIARQQSAVRSRHIHPVCVGDRVPDVIRGRFLRTQHLH
jgi:hypothetical protein